MSFFEFIDEKGHAFLSNVIKMQENGHPIVLIGAGWLAQITWDFLQRNQVAIKHIALNHAWLSEEYRFNGMPVVAIEELASSGKKMNYIYAMQFVSEELVRLLSATTIESLKVDQSVLC